jgi:hypothetical protein
MSSTPFRVFTSSFPCFSVVSRTNFRRFCSSARFLKRVRFPAAPLKLQFRANFLTSTHAHQHHIANGYGDAGMCPRVNHGDGVGVEVGDVQEAFGAYRDDLRDLINRDEVDGLWVAVSMIVMVPPRSLS